MPRRTAVYSAIGTAILLSVLGVALIYSASHRIYGAELAVKQGIWLLIGLLVAVGINQCSRKWLFRSTWVLYGLGLLLLVATLMFGITIRGDRSWLDLGVVHLQASEIMKLFLVLAMARVSQYYSTGELSVRMTLLCLLGLFLLPFGLIMAQPDLGTALVYLFIVIGWMFVIGFWSEATVLATGLITGIGGSFVALIYSGSTIMRAIEYVDPGYSPMGTTLLFLGLAGVVAVWPYFLKQRIGLWSGIFLTGLSFLIGTHIPSFLAGYQKQRLLVYLNPYQSPMESGYNIIQAQIAIGSGGWFGQGYLEGSQSQLGFIPELWTDFIFSVAVEELGFVMGGFLILGFIIYVYCYYSVAIMAADWEGYYISAGFGLIAMIHVVLNIAVCVGVVPVVGLPLPFVSYGGSFMVTNWLMIGVLTVVSRRLSGQALLKSAPDRKRVG